MVEGRGVLVELCRDFGCFLWFLEQAWIFDLRLGDLEEEEEEFLSSSMMMSNFSLFDRWFEFNDLIIFFRTFSMVKGEFDGIRDGFLDGSSDEIIMELFLMLMLKL